MTIMYGQTETSPVITMASSRRFLGTPRRDRRLRVRIDRGENLRPDGSTVPLGEQGEIVHAWLSGDEGYDQEPEATARAIDEEGWLHTGDLATMRPDGYFRITGRLKDMIIRGGEKFIRAKSKNFCTHIRSLGCYRWSGCRI